MASTTVAAIALAVIGPIPGIVASRRLTSFERCQDEQLCLHGADTSCHLSQLGGKNPQHLASQLREVNATIR